MPTTTPCHVDCALQVPDWNYHIVAADGATRDEGSFQHALGNPLNTTEVNLSVIRYYKDENNMQSEEIFLMKRGHYRGPSRRPRDDRSRERLREDGRLSGTRTIETRTLMPPWRRREALREDPAPARPHEQPPVDPAPGGRCSMPDAAEIWKHILDSQEMAKSSATPHGPYSGPLQIMPSYVMDRMGLNLQDMNQADQT